MSRFVQPMSKEEWEKLPEWKKWMNRHWWLFVGLFVVLAVLSVVLVNYCK